MGHMIEVREYLDAEGKSPYAKWFDRLNVAAAVKVTTAVHRMEQGNFCNVWVPASMSTESILVLAIESTLARKGTGW